MAEIIFLSPGKSMPHLPDYELWLIVEASDDGRFFGTGFGRKPSGEGVFYVSLAETDVSLKTAIAAAEDWAEERGVPRIWVQASPE